MCEYPAYWHRKSGEGEMAMENKAEVMVAIICFNHEEYIAQCLDSVFAQQCNFDYRVCVFDDCSTDRSMDIARSYQEKYGDRLQIVQPETNQHKLGIYSGSLRNFLRVNDAKYMAFCEADDYWTDNTKLQKQHDALERDPNTTLCVCNIELKDVEHHVSVGVVPGKVPESWSKEEIINRILTYDISFRLNGYMVRMSVFEHTDIYNEYWNYWAWDNALVSYCLLHGKFAFVDNCMAVKRVNNAGSYSRKYVLEMNAKWQMGIFEKDLRWIEEFRKMADGKFDSLIQYFITYRKIRMYYLERNELEENSLVSNVNGKMYKSAFLRKWNRLYIRMVKALYRNNETAFVRQKATWMMREQRRLQKISGGGGLHLR